MLRFYYGTVFAVAVVVAAVAVVAVVAAAAVIDAVASTFDADADCIFPAVHILLLMQVALWFYRTAILCN